MTLLEWLDDQMQRGADPVGIKGTLDALGVTLGRLGATSVGGYRGLYDYLTSDMTDEDLQRAIGKIGETVQAADDWMLPRTTEGFPQAMENFESVMKPVGEFWRENVSQPLGNMAYENAGDSPLAGALTQATAEVLPHFLLTKRPTATPAPTALPPEMRLDAPAPQLPAPPKPSFDPSRRQFLKDTATVAATPALSPLLRAFPETPAPAVVEAAAPAVAETVAPTLSNAGKTIMDYALSNATKVDLADLEGWELETYQPLIEASGGSDIVSYTLPDMFGPSGASFVELVGNDTAGYQLYNPMDGEFFTPDTYGGELYNVPQNGVFATKEQAIEAYMDGEFAMLEDMYGSSQMPTEFNRDMAGAIDEYGIYTQNGTPDLATDVSEPMSFELPSIDALNASGISADQFLANMLGAEGTPSAPSSVGNPLLDNPVPSQPPRSQDAPTASRLPDFQPKPDVPYGLKDIGSIGENSGILDFNLADERGPAGFSSKLRRALAEMADKRAGSPDTRPTNEEWWGGNDFLADAYPVDGLPQRGYDIMTREAFLKELKGRGISDEEMRYSGLDLDKLSNGRAGAGKISIGDALAELRPLSDRVGQFIQTSYNPPKEDKGFADLSPAQIMTQTKNSLEVTPTYFASVGIHDAAINALTEHISTLPDMIPVDAMELADRRLLEAYQIPSVNYRSVEGDRGDYASDSIMGNEQIGYYLWDEFGGGDGFGGIRDINGQTRFDTPQEATQAFIDFVLEKRGYEYDPTPRFPAYNMDDLMLMYGDEMFGPSRQDMAKLGHWTDNEAESFFDKVMMRDDNANVNDIDTNVAAARKLAEFVSQRTNLSFDEAKYQLVDMFNQARDVKDFIEMGNELAGDRFGMYFEDKVSEWADDEFRWGDNNLSGMNETVFPLIDPVGGEGSSNIRIIGSDRTGYAPYDDELNPILDNPRITFQRRYDALEAATDQLKAKGYEFLEGNEPRNTPEDVRFRHIRAGYPTGDLYENIILTDKDAPYAEEHSHFGEAAGEGLNLVHSRNGEYEMADGLSYHISEVQSDPQSSARKAGGFDARYKVPQWNEASRNIQNYLREEAKPYRDMKGDFENIAPILYDNLLSIPQQGAVDGKVQNVFNDYLASKNVDLWNDHYDAELEAFKEAAYGSSLDNGSFNRYVNNPDAAPYIEQARKRAEGLLRDNIERNVDSYFASLERKIRDSAGHSDILKEAKSAGSSKHGKQIIGEAREYLSQIPQEYGSIYDYAQKAYELAMKEYQSDMYDLAASRTNSWSQGLPEHVPLESEHTYAMLAKNLMRAVELGYDRITVSNSKDVYEVSRTRDSDLEGFQNVYDKNVPAALKKLARKYGTEPKRIPVGDESGLKHNGEWRWGIEITPEMKEAIEKYGIDLYSKVDNPLLDKASSPQQIGGMLGLA